MRHRLKGLKHWPLRDVGDSVLYHAQTRTAGKGNPIVGEGVKAIRVLIEASGAGKQSPIGREQHR
jgi:hypothetical protein